MAIPVAAGLDVLRILDEVFTSVGVDYWVGRGVFRRGELHGEFGDQQGDIDVHVRREDEPALWDAIDVLVERGFSEVEWQGPEYKVPLIRDGIEVEIQFLELDGDVRWYRAGGHGQIRFEAPASVFGNRRLEISGVSVRVPDKAYLPAVYGDQWEAEVKGTGGKPVEES